MKKEITEKKMYFRIKNVILLLSLSKLLFLVYFAYYTFFYIYDKLDEIKKFQNLDHFRFNYDTLINMVLSYVPYLIFFIIAYFIISLIKKLVLNISISKSTINKWAENMDPILGRYLVNHFRLYTDLTYEYFIYYYSLTKNQRNIVNKQIDGNELNNLFNKFDKEKINEDIMYKNK